MRSATQPRSHRPNPSAAPFILDAVGDVGRPRGGVPPSEDLSHLPGSNSRIAGLTNVAGWMLRGNAHLREQALRYGRIYRHRFGLIPTVFVTDPGDVAAIARNEDKVWSASLAWRVWFEGTTSSPTLDFPIALDFGIHQEARRFLQTAFSGAALESYVRVAAEMFDPAVDTWIKRGKVSFKREVRRLFALVMARILMGVSDDAEAEFLDRATNDLWGAPSSILRNEMISPKWRRAVRGFTTLESTFRSKIETLRRGEGQDLFSRLCREEHGLDWLDDAGLVRMFIGVISASFDTTAMGLTSMAYLLARHPEWQERLREEGRSVSPASIARDDAKKLVIYEWVWKETLRLLPVIPSLPRRALRDVRIAGYRIPAGAFVMAAVCPAQLDPAYWTDPDTFDPERFSPQRAEDKKSRGGFMPFGAGPHACIGARLSILEATVFWHAFLSRARIRLARPRKEGHQFLPIGVVKGPVDLIVEPL